MRAFSSGLSSELAAKRSAEFSWRKSLEADLYPYSFSESWSYVGLFIFTTSYVAPRESARVFHNDAMFLSAIPPSLLAKVRAIA